MIVGFGLDEQLRDPVEVHCYYTTGFLITLRRAPCPALADLRREASVRPLLENGDPIRALHHLITALHAPFATLVLRLDERLDALEQQVLREADDQDLAGSRLKLTSRPSPSIAAQGLLLSLVASCRPDALHDPYGQRPDDDEQAHVQQQLKG